MSLLTSAATAQGFNARNFSRKSHPGPLCWFLHTCPSDFSSFTTNDYLKARMRHWLGGADLPDQKPIDTISIERDFSPASANVYRFSSKEIHVTSGLYCYGYRFYDPNLQRWPN